MNCYQFGHEVRKLKNPFDMWAYFPISGAMKNVALKKKKKRTLEGVPIVAQCVRYPASIHEDVSSIPGLAQWVKDPELP